MPRPRPAFFAAAVLAMAFPPLHALAADSFAGSYAGDKLSAEINPHGASYTGTVQLGAQSFPLKARAANGQLAGTLTSNGHDFTFTNQQVASVNGIDNALNDGANDPHRFVQIPLRDERDPLIAP